MEPVKKRRNSILKKKSADEDTTTDTKARRISFSGKKSVKEFIAGEEAATIWGTSYEESADDLKLSSCESGLVNVHVKRIQLRNRRVVCEPAQQKRRSSLKKKVLIAENDKENLCVKPNSPIVEIVETVVQDSNAALPLVRIDQPQSKYQTKSELAMEKSEQNVVVSKSHETMLPKKLVDISSVCSNTFDFINFSAQINKTITIEQSLDVSLNESELQLFKFRVPVTAPEISPNTSNVLCRSILMSEEDVNILKMVRKQKGEKNNFMKEQIVDEELKMIETKKRDVGGGVTNISEAAYEETIVQRSEQSVKIDTGDSSIAMDISENYDGKGAKRKSERTVQTLPLDSTLVDMNSPMRKKPMHTSFYTSMDDTNNPIGKSSQKESNGRPTVYDSVIVEESAVGQESLAITNFLAHTIFDSKTISNESSSFPNTTAACLAFGNQTDGISMELSLCAPNNGENMRAMTKTTILPEEIKKSQTVYDASIVEEITLPTNQIAKNTFNQRESIYTSIYMDEESPKPTKASKSNNTKGLQLRQTIVTPEEIYEDTRQDNDPKCAFQKTIATPIEIYEDSFIQDEPDNKENKNNRKTIYDPVEIKEDANNTCQQSRVDSNKNTKKRESIYTPTDMIEESPKPNESKKVSQVGQQKRQTILRKEDMVTELGTASNTFSRTRQTIFKPEDIELDAVPPQSSIGLSKKNNPRQSIYTPSDIVLDSPKSIPPSETQSKQSTISSGGLRARQTIFTPVDIVEDASKECTSKSEFQRTVVKSIDMLENSVQEDALIKTVATPRIEPINSCKRRESVYSPSDMLEESVVNAPTQRTSQVTNCSTSLKTRQTIFTPEDIIDDSIKEIEADDVRHKTTNMPISFFEISQNTEPAYKSIEQKVGLSKNMKGRESVYTPSDMIEDSPKPTRTVRVDPDPKKCQTILAPQDLIVEDFPRESASKSLLQKTNKTSTDIFSEAQSVTQQITKSRQTIYDPADIEEVTVPIQQAITSSHTASNALLKNRKTIYDAVDIEEATCPFKPGFERNNSEGVNAPSDMADKYPTCNESRKQQSFESEDIIEDEVASRSLAQKTITTPFNIFEDSIQEEPVSKLAAKDRRTVFDNADIEEDEAPPTQHAISVCPKNKSVNIPSEIVLHNLGEAKPVRNNSTTSKASNNHDETKSNAKRQTTYKQVDLSLDPKTHASVESEAKHDQKPRTTIYTPADIEEDRPKTSTKLRPPSKIQVLRRELSSTDLNAKKSMQIRPGEIQNSNQQNTQCPSKAPKFSYAVHQSKLKRRVSIHTPVDMVEDSPKPVKPTQSTQSKDHLRKTVYEPCDIKTDSPKQAAAENIQANITKCSPVTITDKPKEQNKRETVYTPVEMMEDSPRKTVEQEVKQTRLCENKPRTFEIGAQVDRGSDLPFRKPTKLFSETYKSLDNPYSSTKSLMDKVMQDMGYSMDFQLPFAPETASSKPPQPKKQSPQKDLYLSMNMTVEQDVKKDVENSMELSIANEKTLKTNQQKTMYLSEGIDEVKVGNENHIQSQSRPQLLYKTSFDDSQMELSVRDVNDKAMNNKSSTKMEFCNNKSHATSYRPTTDDSMGVSLLKSHISYEQGKQPEVLRESRRQTIHFNQDLDEEDIHDSQKSTTNTEKGQKMLHKMCPSQTMLIDEDLEVEQIDDQQKGIAQVPKSQAPCRKTIHCYEDLEVENLQQSTVASISRQVNDRIELNKENTLPKETRRKTMHLNEDLETSLRNPLHEFNQQTINSNENIEEEDEINQQQLQPSEQLSLPAKKKQIRRTILMNQDLDLCEIDDSHSVLSQHTSNEPSNNYQRTKHDEIHLPPQKSNRQTTHFNQDLELSNIGDNGNSSAKIPSQDCIKTNRRTNLVNEDLDVEKTQLNSAEAINHHRSNRQTIHLNQDLDLCEMDVSQVVPTRSSVKSNYLNQDRVDDVSKQTNTEVIESNLYCQTIHFNHDLSEIDSIQKVLLPMAFRDSTNRKTDYLSKDIEIEEPNEKVIPHNRPTTQDREGDKLHHYGSNRRQTILESQELDMSIDAEDHLDPQKSVQTSQVSHRRTVYLQQELDMDEQVQTNEKSVYKQDSNAVPKRNNHSSLHQKIEVDDDARRKNLFNETKRNTEENACRFPMIDASHLDGKSVTFNNKSELRCTRNRQTVHFTTDNDLEESIQAAEDKRSVNPCVAKEKEVSSKLVSKQPRRVTICDAQPLDMDESILPKSTARKSSFMRTLNFDEVPTEMSHHKSTSVGKLKATQDDESPVYNPRLRPKCPMTPSEVDRSLAEYLKVEAAIEDEEEDVFYDAEDGTDNEKSNKRQTCHMPINILEESGMQPLPSQSLKRQTTFSPQKMTNESLNYSETIQTQNKISQNASSNPMRNQALDSSPKGIFQKTLKSTEMMDMTHADSSPKGIFQKSLKSTETMDMTHADSSPKGIFQKSLKSTETMDIPHADSSPKGIFQKSLKSTETMNMIHADSSPKGIFQKSLKSTETMDMTHADSSPKGIFQKSLKSTEMMDMTHAPHDSNNYAQQTLMQSRLGTNFDENTFKTGVQRNRQTIHFNESINIADVSTTWKPSSAVQSVKELLLENTRLFSQSNLIKPSAFEKPRSTVFFVENNDSMDVSCTDNSLIDAECTPTKNKTSRIPQLIGSAKKLESLKKSMEFIQQELPNIGSHLRNNEAYFNVDDSSEEQETPRRFSTSIPKKLQEMEESVDEILCETIESVESPQKGARQLQESFETIDIPRKVLSCVRKTIEESPRRGVRKLEEHCDADDISRRTINVSPKVLQESFDTVEIPRRGTTFQRNDTLYICPNEKEMTINASHKSFFQFEEPPITISDVSTFFSQKPFPTAKQATATYSPNTTAALCKLNVNEIQALSRSPNSDDTTHNVAHFKKRYVELTCDSLLLSDSRDNIEKTHLSLVNTFDDESEMVQPHRDTDIEIPAESSPPRIKPKSSVCKKCKCQRLSITQNDTTIGSFMLESLPVYKVDLSELEQLAKKPNIAAVGKVWRQKLRESDSFNVSDDSRSMAMDDEDLEAIEKLLMELADERLANAQYRQKNRKEVKIENSFLYKVRKKMQSKSNWMINDILLFNNIIVLTHKRIRTFAIIINFTPKDPRGVEVIFNDIQLKPNMLHTHQWKPFEYALHYQLLVELPFDLKKICPTSEEFFDLLDHVDKVTEDVLNIGKEMLTLVLTSPASLIREPSGRLYIRKYVRTKTPQNDVKRTEFHIEVRNIKKLSYESIAMPPLYEFDENIQSLPVGNDFLRNFLNDPLKFVKK